MDWNLPPIYDEYTEDGQLIVHSIQNSSFMGSDFNDAISKTIDKSEIRQDAEKASGGCLATLNFFGYNFKASECSTNTWSKHHCRISVGAIIPHFKIQGRIFSNQGRMMQEHN